MSDAAKAYTALAKAQTEMGKALKKSTNPHFRAAYADLGAVQDACMPALHANGFAVYQPTGQDEMGPFVKTVLAHESGEVLECRTPLLIDKNNMQGLGSAITYARRYGLLCMSGLAPEDDDGNATVEQVKRPDPEAEALRERLITDTMVSLQSCTTMEELGASFQRAQHVWKERGYGEFPVKLVSEKDRLKKQLKEAA